MTTASTWVARAAAMALLTAAPVIVPASVAGAGAPPPPPVTMIATQVVAGQGYACAVLTDSDVACFGTNGYGQLGLGRWKAYTLVGKRSGQAGAVAVAAGYDFSCVLLLTRQVTCVGHDDRGQLGPDARRPNQWTPGPVIPGLHDVVQVTAGEAFACALLASKRVECWGDNDVGQLGRSPKHLGQRAAPGLVPGLRDVVDLASGANFSCAVEADHSVWCWGENTAGDLGRGLGDLVAAAPTRVHALGAATQVSAGSSFACARLVTGRVACWGSNSRRQLGIAAAVVLSVSPRVVPRVFGATEVATGDDHACALSGARTVTCWGSDALGQLGIGHPARSEPPGRAVPIHGVLEVTAGLWATCVLLTNSTVRCWGDGQLGELGIGDRATWVRPAPDALVREAAA